MEFKKMAIVLAITLTIIFCIGFGASYAWYAYDNASTIAKGSTIKEAPTVIFRETDRIRVSQNMPIYDQDRYNYGNKFSFTISLGENLSKYETAYDIELDGIIMSEELKSNNYKYELLQDGKTVSTGDFSEIANNKVLTVLPMKIYTPEKYPTTYTYDLYIWLSEDGTDQNNLMNKLFIAKLKVNSANKKR